MKCYFTKPLKLTSILLGDTKLHLVTSLKSRQMFFYSAQPFPISLSAYQSILKFPRETSNSLIGDHGRTYMSFTRVLSFQGLKVLGSYSQWLIRLYHLVLFEIGDCRTLLMSEIENFCRLFLSVSKQSK